MKLTLGSRRLALICAMIAALGACGQVNSARLTFPSAQQQFGTIVLVASSKGKFLIPKGGISPDLDKEIQNCGLKSSRAERETHYRIEASLKFADNPSLAAALDCFPADLSKRNVTLSTTENFWSTDYVATVWFEQPWLVRSNGELERFHPAPPFRAGRMVQPVTDMLPIELSVEMPANVVAIENYSAISRARTETLKQGNIALIKYFPDPDIGNDPAHVKLVRAADRGAKVVIPQDRYKFIIRARKSKFEIGSLGVVLSLLGLLLGSGVGVQIFSWFRSRRAAQVKTADQA